MNARNVWMWASAALLCATIVTSYSTLYYYNQVDVYKRNYDSLLGDIENLTILVNLKIDYGNGTVAWHNRTLVPLDANLLNATRRVTSVEYSVGEFGAFVKKVNGVGGGSDRFWLWSYLDGNTGKWTFGTVASDRWILHNGDIVAWTLTAF